MQKYSRKLDVIFCNIYLWMGHRYLLTAVCQGGKMPVECFSKYYYVTVYILKGIKVKNYFPRFLQGIV